ncbi:MAG: ATP-dependent RecD-like DNA helicase [Lentisphaeria bacterium]|nr:ATP-dependent RecD-like DNA helicase [Lentisphaeria bacterium]
MSWKEGDLPLQTGESKQKPNHRLTGTAGHVVYMSEDRQYVVMRALEHHGEPTTIVGAISGLNEGQDFEAEGRWTKHKEYGRQFQVETYEAVLPRNHDGIIRYLSSGILPKVGVKTAERIVDHFGLDTLNILDNYSERLLEVKGISKNKLVQIRDAWSHQQENREKDVFLHGIGLSAAYATRVYKQFGQEAVAIIQVNPYRLTEVRGIGFQLADRVAKKMDIRKEDPSRLCAGVAFVLKQFCERDGHSCVPRGVVIQKAAEILDVDFDHVKLGIQAAVNEGTLFPEQDLLYLRSIYQLECEVAHFVKQRIANVSFRLDKEIPHSDNWKMLNSQQQKAVTMALNTSLGIVTGGPGVGKTTVIKEIVHAARKLDKHVRLCAPTGRAAKRMTESTGEEAKTIHRLLGWNPGTSGFRHHENAPIPCDLLIVDEVSMIDLALCCSLLKALAPTTAVIFVGDKDQLPSVGAGRILADFLATRAVPVTHLHQVYRQAADSHIITNAHKVNKGESPIQPKQSSEELTDFYWIQQDEPEQVLEMIQKLCKERIPERYKYNPLQDIQVLAPMVRGVCGTKNLNLAMQESLNPINPLQPFLKNGDRQFSAGDRVMQIMNNYDLNVYNGDLGFVYKIDTLTQKFIVEYDQGFVEYKFEELEQIRHAYAITIHKSQGSEFPVVIIPLLNSHFMMLQRKLLYTAMTRASKLLILIGGQKAIEMAVRNVSANPRFSKLKDRILDGQ